MAQERVALVTGGTRGIGAAISKRLKEKGYKVAANYGGNDEAANAFKAETGIPVFKFDVGDLASCEAGIKAIEAEVGPIDILANSAGVNIRGPVADLSEADWDAVLGVNLKAPFLLARQYGPAMAERGWGRIIHLG